MRNTYLNGIALAVAGIVLFSSGARAEETKDCVLFDIYSSGEGRLNQDIDTDGNGTLSAGDREIGYRVLTDANGKKIGERHFVALVTGVDGAGKETARNTDVIVSLEGGALYLLKQKVDGKNLNALILGGTGRFTGATGTEATSADGQKNVYHYRVNCKEGS